eukprot:GHVT01045419.1.p1 GENE.GHVT01045419.1~~GHVT01045419.1.p1  ORF type:complete len:111 (+),score=11.93 GHVT01045419.1:1216-1548(+)
MGKASNLEAKSLAGPAIKAAKSTPKSQLNVKKNINKKQPPKKAAKKKVSLCLFSNPHFSSRDQTHTDHSTVHLARACTSPFGQRLLSLMSATVCNIITVLSFAILARAAV